MLIQWPQPGSPPNPRIGRLYIVIRGWMLTPGYSVCLGGLLKALLFCKASHTATHTHKTDPSTTRATRPRDGAPDVLTPKLQVKVANGNLVTPSCTGTVRLYMVDANGIP